MILNGIAFAVFLALFAYVFLFPFAAAIWFEIARSRRYGVQKIGFIVTFVPAIMVLEGKNPWNPYDWIRLLDEEPLTPTNERNRSAMTVKEQGIKSKDGDGHD